MPVLTGGGAGRGVFLHLMTQSFAVRALLGSLAAAGLASLAVRAGMVRSSRARRLLVLAPVLTAAGAAMASIGEGFLPRLIITSARGDQLINFAGVAVPQRELSIVFVAYVLVALLLLLRRLLGVLVASRALRPARPLTDPVLIALVSGLAARMGTRVPRLLALQSCPGGAFTVGTRRPIIAIDPELVQGLDDRELEGLLAHELAHIRRRDTLLGVLVGLVRDVGFFLPPLHMAARWLRSEQEESADEFAAACTRRPAALASSILKVWDCGHRRRPLPIACAVTGRLSVAPAGWPLSLSRFARRPDGAISAATRALAVRVERLIAAGPAPSVKRVQAEFALAAGVLAVALGAAVVVPSYLAVTRQVDALSFGYLRAAPEGPVESSAFATFRAVTAPAVTSEIDTSEIDTSDMDTLQAAARPAVPAAEPLPCPCVESPAQLHQRIGASEPARSHSWGADASAPYDFRHTDATRELWTLSDSGPQVGVFLVTRPR